MKSSDSDINKIKSFACKSFRQTFVWRFPFVKVIVGCLIFLYIICNLRVALNNRISKDKILREETIDGSTLLDIIQNANDRRFRGSKIKGKDLIETMRTQINQSNRVLFSNATLCVTFTFSSESALTSLTRKLKSIVNGTCDWAIFVYGGDKDLANNYYRNTLPRFKSEHSRVALFEFNVTKEDILRKHLLNYVALDNNSLTHINHRIFPKPMILLQLLPMLSEYSYVWVFDEDIHISNFNLMRFLYNVHDSFNNSPILIAQPLILDNTQAYTYLNYNSWNKSEYKDISAAETRFVEIQTPIFVSTYLEWFLQNIVKENLWAIFVLGADWGLDSMFCPLAIEFSKQLHSMTSKTSIPCAVIIDGSPVHHSNDRSIDYKIGYNIRKTLNRELVRILEQRYHGFMLRGLKDECNPLESKTLRLSHKLSI